MKNFFVVLGGMGTMASESFIHVLNQRTPAYSDQEYLNYVLVNHATVPDRTAFILKRSQEDPRQALIEDIKQYDKLGHDFFVLTCNTAHYFYEELSQVTTRPLLHMPKLAVREILQENEGKKGKIKVGLLATEGTVQSNIYSQELENTGRIEVLIPSDKWQQKVTDLIYRDVKEKKFFNHELYQEILHYMIVEKQCDVCLLGCTELSLMEANAPKHFYPVVDAQSVLIDETLKLGIEMQKNR